MKPLLMPFTLLVMIMVACAPACQAAARPLPSGVSLLKASLDNYDHAKTIQGTVTLRLDQGGTLTKTTMAFQASNRPGGQIARERVEITTDDATLPGNIAGGGRLIYVYNGQTLYTLYPALKQFTAQQGADRFSNLFRSAVQRYLAAGGTATAQPARVGGAAVIILTGKAHSFTGKAHSFTMQAILSPGDRVLQSFTLTAPDKRHLITMTVTGLRLNKPLPPALSWEPPTDYTPLIVTHGTPNAELPDFSLASPKSPKADSSATAAATRAFCR